MAGNENTDRTIVIEGENNKRTQTLDLYLRRGSLILGTKQYARLEWAPWPEGTAAEPFSLTNEEAKNLLSVLWGFGVRPYTSEGDVLEAPVTVNDGRFLIMTLGGKVTALRSYAGRLQASVHEKGAWSPWQEIGALAQSEAKP